MKVFRDLEVTGPADKLKGLVTEMTAAVVPGWSRDAEAEARLGAISGEDEPAGIAFARQGTDALPPSGVFLSAEPQRLRVMNIVPRQAGQLSIDQYNAILDEFTRKLLRPAADKIGDLKIERTGADVDITRWITPEAAKLLQRFSGAANKATGSSHPSDFKRWREFLVRVHRDGSQLDGEILRRWLIEEHGWPEDSAEKLASEYEFAHDLLQTADADTPA